MIVLASTTHTLAAVVFVVAFTALWTYLLGRQYYPSFVKHLREWRAQSVRGQTLRKAAGHTRSSLRGHDHRLGPASAALLLLIGGVILLLTLIDLRSPVAVMLRIVASVFIVSGILISVIVHIRQRRAQRESG